MPSSGRKRAGTEARPYEISNGHRAKKQALPWQGLLFYVIQSICWLASWRIWVGERPVALLMNLRKAATLP